MEEEMRTKNPRIAAYNTVGWWWGWDDVDDDTNKEEKYLPIPNGADWYNKRGRRTDATV